MASETAEAASDEIGDSTSAAAQAVARPKTVFGILIALSLSHTLNDVMQSLLPALYPLFSKKYDLDHFQIGLITFAFQCTASLLQPVVGILTDRRPWPWSLPAGTIFTLVGLVWLAYAASFASILGAAALVGVGSSVFHPEASRVARLASGGRYGFAQSLFQVGGNSGTALGPLLAAFVVAPYGQKNVAWFTLGMLVACTLLAYVGRWYAGQLELHRTKPRAATKAVAVGLSPARVRVSIVILLTLVFSKYIYLASLTTYYQFYLMKRFSVSEHDALIYLFVFLGAIAVGTVGGGPVGDRIGFRKVIWGSILGVLPFTLALPHVNLFWTVVLTVPIGLVLASAFSAIIVYAQELLPSRVGLVAGMFFGFAFGIAGVGAAVLGKFSDWYGIEAVYRVVAYLPLLGLLTYFLPRTERI